MLIAMIMWHVGTLRSVIDKQTVEIKSLNNDLILSKSVIDTQNDTIAKITEARKSDSKALDDLLKFHNSIVVTYNKRITDRKTLESKNVETKSYLDTDVPYELRSLLDSQNSKFIGSH